MGIHYRRAYKESPAIANPTTAPRKPTDTPMRVPLLLNPAAVVAVLEDAAPAALPEAEEPDELPLPLLAPEIG